MSTQTGRYLGKEEFNANVRLFYVLLSKHSSISGLFTEFQLFDGNYDMTIRRWVCTAILTKELPNLVLLFCVFYQICRLKDLIKKNTQEHTTTLTIHHTCVSI